MAYQPLYAEISDTNATRHTTSLRSRVEWIDFNLNSHFGKVLIVSASSKGNLPKADDYEAEQKIKLWTEKENLKKVEAWKLKLKERKEFNLIQESQESVEINIEPKLDNPKFKFIIHGIEITKEKLEKLK